jgi:hypothetical protein
MTKARVAMERSAENLLIPGYAPVKHVTVASSTERFSIESVQPLADEHSSPDSTGTVLLEDDIIASSTKGSKGRHHSRAVELIIGSPEPTPSHGTAQVPGYITYTR